MSQTTTTIMPNNCCIDSAHKRLFVTILHNHEDQDDVSLKDPDQVQPYIDIFWCEIGRSSSWKAAYRPFPEGCVLRNTVWTSSSSLKKVLYYSMWTIITAARNKSLTAP